MMGFLLAAAGFQSFAAGTPAFDPRNHKQEIGGRPAEVLVLGSPHLSQLPDRLDPALLEPLLRRLAAFDPDVITVEGLSGEECDTLLRFKPQHGSAWDDNCWSTEDAEKATGLTVPAALSTIEEMLASWPARPDPALRRRLAMLFLAANDRASAQVQWLRLSQPERRTGDGLTAAMVEILERKGKPLNENYAIGSALAAKLGLDRIYLTDDHLADGADRDPDYGPAIQAAWDAKPAPPVRAEFEKRQKSLKTTAELLGLYRFLNEPETQRASIAADMGRAAAEPSAKMYGRRYVSWWENRNLRMAANIRGAFAAKPDARVLVIVGSTHKGYLDAYLDMMQDVRLVDAMTMLK